MSSPYIELHAASAFSFLQGASLPEALIDRAAGLGCSTLALLDRDGVYGLPRFHKAAQAAGIRAIVGAELTIEATAAKPRSTQNSRNPQSHHVSANSVSALNVAQPFLLPVLCESQEGYRNLCRLITKMKMRAPEPGSPPRTPARWGAIGSTAGMQRRLPARDAAEHRADRHPDPRQIPLAKDVAGHDLAGGPDVPGGTASSHEDLSLIHI